MTQNIFLPSFFAEENAGCNLSAKLSTAIKSKCTQEEIQNILKEVSDEEQDQQFNQLKVSPESLVLIREQHCKYDERFGE